MKILPSILAIALTSAAWGGPDFGPTAAETAQPPASPEAQMLRPGMVAQDFVTADIHDRAVRLADYQGKVVVLDFWAT
ncbi:MAG: hypothetical protein PHQ04_01760 [Opitutaceae bacterium]|nr:hypothetical protein [Opitutaceae bacterium]